MLPRLTCVYVEWRYSTPVIASFETYPVFVSHLGYVHVKPNASLKDDSGFTAIPSVIPEKQKVAAGFEVPEPAAKAEPGGKVEIWKEAETRRWSHKKRTVLLRNLIGWVVQVFVGIENDWEFHRKICPIGAAQDSRVTYIETNAFAMAHDRVRNPGVGHREVAHKGVANRASDFVIAQHTEFLGPRDGHRREHQSADEGNLRQSSPSRSLRLKRSLARGELPGVG